MASEVGVAYVKLLPSMNGFSSAVSSELSSSLPGAGKDAGSKAGTAAGNGFKAGMSKGLSGVKGKMTGALKSAGAGALGAAAGFMAFGAVKGAITGAISSASDLNETVNKSKAIFGSSAGQIDTWAKGAAQNLGLSRGAALDAAAGFGDMFNQIGFSGKAAAAMSKDVVQVAADLGSFNNLGTDDVADRISAAFRGEYDSLQAVIPNINAARVETEAMAMTGKKAAKDLTAQEKAAAVLAIVHKDGARAMGDFANTSDQLANSQKIQAAETENLKAQLGAGLLPIQLKLTRATTAAVVWGQKHQGVLKAIAIVVGGVLVGAFTALAVSVIAATWPFLAIGAAVAALAAGFVWLYKNNETVRKAIDALGKVVQAVGRVIMAAATAVWQSIKTRWGAIKPFVSATFRAVATVVRAYVKVWLTVVRTYIGLILGAVRGIARIVGYVVGPVRTAVSRAKSALSSLVSFVRGLPGKFRGALSGLWDGLRSGFRSAVNYVIGAWNRLSFSIGGGSILGKKIPSVTLSTPDIPYLASGGITNGPTLAMIGEGREQEVVSPLSKLGAVAAAAGVGGGVTVVIDASGLDRGLAEWLRHAVRVRGGGNVQVAFGR